MAEPATVPAPTSFEEAYDVTRVERRTPTIVELELRPQGDILEYLPGEYVLLEDDLHELPPRSYSVANAPRRDRTIFLLVTRVADGATSRWVHERCASAPPSGSPGCTARSSITIFRPDRRCTWRPGEGSRPSARCSRPSSVRAPASP